MTKSTIVFFCGKAQARIARYLESKHTKQDEIKDINTGYQNCLRCKRKIEKVSPALKFRKLSPQYEHSQSRW